MMKKRTKAIIKLAVFLPLVLPLTSCTAGKIDPSKALTQMHIVKNDDYKKRPGWDAVVRLTDNDCETQKSGGKSLIKWNGSTCDTKAIIDFVNKKPQFIPIFYAAYHEYGSDGLGVISFDSNERTEEELMGFASKLTEKLTNKNLVDAIFADFKNDRWSMGLDDVDKESFNKAISSFRVKREQIEARYQEVRNENQQRYQAEHEAQAKRDQEELIASERPINLVLWTNPTPEQKIILNALNTIKFTIRGNRVTYANGRWFMSVDGLESLRNSLDMSLSSCSDVGAYAGEKVISRACVQGLAGNIVEWGKTAKDTSISDRAWRAAAIDGSITYNPIKYEILFGHWSGMARVYASRGY
ncbi:hypothetical protein [Klebsiella pneumoniae]|uniref:hypothetical protein n=1 Tax=Klebsiella pneumoniae TaxID=573 RepID=UPI0021D866ED|nr:hypothetical protein [Klebsiella pneumoniae]MCU8622053.1 hypothetical protein [Klebsiella pneumoniae]